MRTVVSRTSMYLSLGLCLALLGGLIVASDAAPARLYVAPDGKDIWSGKLPQAKGNDGPLATLDGARDAIRSMKKAGTVPVGGVVVTVRAGVYELQKPFELAAEDSGTAESPIVYRAQPGVEVRIVGGKVLKGWKPVTDPAVLSRLEPSAQGKVYQTDLKAQGVTEYGSPNGGGLELFFQDKPMTVSRWPNQGFVNIVDVLNIDPVDVRGTKGDMGGKFTYDGDRPKRWAEEKDIWLHGYWFWDWADQRMKVESIDTNKRIISLKGPQHTYGYRKGQWFYAFNLLSEIDQPGEYYVDREAGILYFYPTAPINSGKAIVSVQPTLVKMKDASFVTLRGMTLEAARVTAVEVNGGTKDLIAGCTIRNCGSWAVSVSGGTENGVVGCDIYEMGAGGIALYGGDRATLTPAKHYAENNHVHHYSRWVRVYQPGITLQGVGNIARHNLIDNAPHMGMGFGGNNHIIEYNELHSVCYESNDAGAIYTGRNWTMRGTVLRYNYLHHINGFQGRGCVGMYLDDQFSGTTMYGNVFYNVTRAAMIGGGRDCTIENNIFVDCNPATHVDARGLGWAAPGFDGLKNGLSQVPYQNALWSAAYPQLPNILNEDPMAPRGNVIARNICVGGRWGDFEGKAKPLIKFEDNLLDEDAHFVDANKLDFRLKADSPAWKLGFKRIPVESIGLYKSDLRASWPVKSEVRPMVAAPVTERARRTGGPAVFKVARASGPLSVNGANPAKAMVIAQGIQGEKVAPASRAWLGYDDKNLYLAIENFVNENSPLRPGNTWGQDDAVEIAVQNSPAIKNAPILVLRGYPSGHFEASDEAGAPRAIAERIPQGVQYGAKIVDKSRWTATWSIPWASLGIDPAKNTKFAFNLSVRKTGGPDWSMWQGTFGNTWMVENAGILELVK